MIEERYFQMKVASRSPTQTHPNFQDSGNQSLILIPNLDTPFGRLISVGASIALTSAHTWLTTPRPCSHVAVPRGNNDQSHCTHPIAAPYLMKYGVL